MKSIWYPLALVGALTLSTPVQAKQPAEWLVVEVAALTGPAATVGSRLSKSVKMWADAANESGGIKGKRIRLVSCNDEGRPEKAVACTRDAVRDRASLVFGHTLTASLRAMQPVLANGPVMIMASPDGAPGADTVAFQTSPTQEDIAVAIAMFLQQQKIASVGIIAATDASGEVQVTSTKKAFDERNIRTNIARMDLKATDATSQIASVVGKDTQFVYSLYSGGGAAIVVKSFTNLGLKQPLMVNYANMSQAFIDLIKDNLPPRLLGAGVKAIIPSTIQDPVLRKRAEEFLVAYRAKYNEPADMINILGKFGADVADALLTNVSNPSDVKAAKAFLESTTIESLQRIRFTPKSHIGLSADDVLITEFKNPAWQAAVP